MIARLCKGEHELTSRYNELRDDHVFYCRKCPLPEFRMMRRDEYEARRSGGYGGWREGALRSYVVAAERDWYIRELES